MAFFVLLEHDVTGLIVTVMNKLGVFKRKWNLKFNLERRLLHLIICLLITLVIQVSFHVKNDTCIQRRHCYVDGCNADYLRDREISTRQSHSYDTFQSYETLQTENNTKRSKLYGKCEPLPTKVMHIGSSEVQWFVYPKPTSLNSEEWSHCSLLAHAAAQPNICPDSIVCIPACKGSEDIRTFAPDHRGKCSSPKNKIRKISGTNLENTLLCVVPDLPCYSHEFNDSERRIIVATAYQIVSLVVRLLLVCSCVHNPATRRRFRRLGYALSIVVVGVTGGIYAFVMTELMYFPTWITDAVISFIGGLLIQLLWIAVISWYILGSCSSECCQTKRKQKAEPDGHVEHFKLAVMHIVQQICNDRRHRVHQYESPLEGVMTVCGEKTGQETGEVRASSSSYDTVATDDDDEWSDS